MYTPLATTFTALFCLQFRLEINSFFSNSFFLLEVSRELPQCLTLNTSLVTRIFSLFSYAVSTLFALTFLCVSHSSLQLIFVMFQTCHTFINLSILLPYSSFQFLFFLGWVPIKPLDFANLFRTCKHVSWRFDLPCRCSSNCSGLTLSLPWGGTAHLVPPHLGPVCSGRNQITKTQIRQRPSQPAQASPSGHFGYSWCL